MDSFVLMIQSNISLKAYNTFGIEAKARHFSTGSSVNEINEILSSSTAKQHSLLILGGGSNLLLTKDYDGLVLKNEILGKEIISEQGDDVLVKVGAGENWHQFVMWCIEHELAGLENLSLIPGNVGASPMQNIGAYGVEIKDRFVELEALHIATGQIEKFDNNACNFAYRESVFKRELKDQYVICSVTYRLSKTPNFTISYGAIQDQLELMGITDLSIKAVSDAVIAIRQSKLPDPKVIGNSGSFFKNPVVENSLIDRLKSEFPDMPSYKVDEQHSKLAAGWLIEQAGWKGKTMGNYGVHKKQALVLVNYGGALGSDIYNLSSDIKDSVLDKFGVDLEREVNII